MAKGAKEHAIGFASLDDVRRVSAALAALRAAPMSSAGRAIVTIVGAGYAGAELAAMVADQLRGTGATVELLSPSGDLMKARSSAPEPIHCCYVCTVWSCRLRARAAPGPDARLPHGLRVPPPCISGHVARHPTCVRVRRRLMRSENAIQCSTWAYASVRLA